MQTYLFYDIETTGLNKSFDQILQFAAIRTDMQLNELNRYEIKIRLNPDVIPSPKATIIHHIGIQQAQTGLSEMEGICRIHQLMNESGTISLGYNTLGFDDEFLRFSFYRNLLTPYTHQFSNRCGRMDIYPMTVMYFLFKNNILKWPKKNGKISLKLEALNETNQFFAGAAHNAMVDVEVTLALAKFLFKEEQMWRYLCGYFNKEVDQERASSSEALMIYPKFGHESYFQSLVMFLDQHRYYKNQQLWLRLDAEKFNESPDIIQNYKLVATKKLGEPGFILPLTDRFLRHLNPERQSLAQANKQWLQSNLKTKELLTQYHSEFKFPVYPDTDVEAKLYIRSFWSQEENSFNARFHTATPKEKALMTERLPESELKTLATRLLGRHYPAVMTPNQMEYFSEFMRKSYSDNPADGRIDYSGATKMTSRKALEEISLLRAEPLSDTQIKLLTELENYLYTKKNDYITV